MPGDERVVEVARPGLYLRLENQRLCIESEQQRLGEVPLCDLAALVLSSPQATLSRGVLDAITQSGGSVIVCDQNHQPTAMLLPLIGHHAQTQRLIAQAKSPLPRQKQIWKQLVQCKVRAQAAVLEAVHGNDSGLREIAKKVRSGDPSNVEGWAAQRYWPALMGAKFRRRREGHAPNNALNYGYAILRAGAARALAATGLHPTLGVNHTSRTNPLCLADDLMEPFRPVVDRLVTRLPTIKEKDLDAQRRAALSACLTFRIEHEGESRTVSDWLFRAAASLSSIYLDQRKDLLLPSGLEDGASYR
jgi:CRISPR-associated protein Cas1